MAFVFKFETLRKHRKRIEDEAQRIYLQARTELDDCLALIKSFYQSIEMARQQVAIAQKQADGQGLQTIRNFEHFIDGQKIRVERQRQVARELMTKVEDAQEKLIEAAREFKKIEKLKEKMKEEYKKHQKRLETKRLEDLVVIRSGRKEETL
ncbi:MAG: flagellar export protein FliJ [Bdellovibrionales bacterium]